MEKVLNEQSETALRVLFISQLFDPENSIKGLEFAKRLRKFGHEVEIVTTFPSYPVGKIYPGYQQSWKNVEEHDGIRVVRLPSYISHGTSAVKRMLSYVSFGLVSSIYSLFFARRPDVIYAYYPPVIVGFVAMLVGFFRKSPYIYDVQDLWPEALTATGMVKPGKLTALIEKSCSFIYQNAWRIVVLSDGYKRALLKKNVPQNKIEIIFNWCDESRIGAKINRKIKYFDTEKFNIIYAGNMGAAQALEHVIDAAKIIQDQEVLNINFVFVGSGVAKEQLIDKANHLSLQNVCFHPQVPPDEVGGILEQADVLLVHLADQPVFEITVPSKTQAYLMAGKPILMAVKGDAAQIIQVAKAGVLAEPCNSEAIAKAAIEMGKMNSFELAAMGKNGKIFYQEKMSMESGVRSINAIFRGIMKGAR